MQLNQKTVDKIKAMGVPEGEFPQRQFDALNDEGCFKAVLPEEFGGGAMSFGKNTFQLLKLLRAVGSIDLSLGRIFEGHVNAIFLLDHFGSTAQKQTYFHEAASGGIFGVWNTDAHQDPVGLTKTSSGYSLSGKKIFCSGGLRIQRPLITSYAQGSPQMIIIHRENIDERAEDVASWNPMGMRSSRSTTIDFTGYDLGDDQFLGKPGDYQQQPYFSAGAIRFAAVQLGGAEALAQSAITHLTALNRQRDPVQQRRIGEITILLESGRNWMQRTADVMGSDRFSAADKINHANMVRTAVLDICTEVMRLSERAVGLQGMMQGHTMEKIFRDLTTYLKQPGPDFALAMVGEWASSALRETNFYEV